MYDLVIRSGRVIDPSQGWDSKKDIALQGGQVVAAADSIPPNQARQVVDARGLIVTPGLIDIHVHVYEGVSHYGINADENCIYRGVTTAIDAGSSGAQTFPGFRKYVVEVSRTRILAYLNLSMIGMITEWPPGELEQILYADTDFALKTLEANRDLLLGIKLRLDRHAAGANGREALTRGRAVSDAAGLPLMIHIGDTTPPLPEILAETCAGDVITHCFHDKEGGILDATGQVLPEVRAAAERGVYFDVGHGRGSFSFQVARQAMEQEFLPATISSDLHSHNYRGPVFDLATTMSKFLYLGLTLSEVIEKTTVTPARSIRMENQLGTLRPGACADVTLLELREGAFPLTDSGVMDGRQSVTADRVLVPAGVIRNGKVIFMREIERFTAS
ncbi:MAG TPA: amidohydrolase/deacetylase family metallohydrolase [Anaerolineae bacterium]|nr:amidohydrolase/deacetylase family metallohydrolase [Anaerolineae bacterium]